MAIQIQFRRDTAANWTSANPTLLAGEIGYETDTGKLKIGNGTSAWTALSYGPTITSITTGTISGAAITTSTLNSTPIGGTTPSTGAFTTVTLSAGTNTVQPIKLTSGTNLTTAVAGSVEYDGVIPYFTSTSTQRGVLLNEQFIYQQSNYTLVSQTAAQQLFNGSTGGQVGLTAGAYAFECNFNLSSLSATSGSFGFALGGTATFTQYWTANATKSAFATATSGTLTFNTSANTSITSASTTTTGFAVIQGIIIVAGAGTVIPQVSQTVAAAALVGPGSFFRIRPIGAQAVNYVGNWS